jgi:hypothetical protein
MVDYMQYGRNDLEYAKCSWNSLDGWDFPDQMN